MTKVILHWGEHRVCAQNNSTSTGHSGKQMWNSFFLSGLLIACYQYVSFTLSSQVS